MKKIFVFLLLLLIPFLVRAQECKNNIDIKRIDYVKTEGKVTVLNDAKIENNVAKFDIKFSKLNDSVEYKLLLKNTSDEDYQIDKNSIKSESKNVSYTLNYGDSTVVEAGKEKEISLIIKYDKQVDNKLFVNNEYELNNEMSFALINSNQPNPITNSGLVVAIVVIIAALVLFILGEYKKNKITIALGVMMLFIPIVSALCNVIVKTDSHFVFEKVPTKRCTFDGEMIKGAEFVDGQYVYRYLQQTTAAWRWEDMDFDNVGWGMRLGDRDSTEPVTTEMCTYINDIPVTSFKYTFLSSKAPSVDLSSFNTTNIINMMGMFSGSAFKNLDLSTFDTHNVRTMWGMFNRVDLNNVDLSYLDTSNVENMTIMFGNIEIDKLDVSTFDVSNVTDMHQMFWGAKINDLDLSTFTNEKVENMEHMFMRFKGNINLKGFGTSSVTNFNNMFNEAKTNNLDFSTFDTSKATQMNYMFAESDMEIIDVSNFTTESVEDIQNMFYKTTAKEIDISGFRTGTLKTLYNTFNRSANLEKIYASREFDPSKLNSSTGYNFAGNDKLYGGAGTYCKEFYNDPVETAHLKVDEGPSSPGCFSVRR